MKISEDLKKSIKDAVIIALQTFAADNDVDERITIGVIEVLEQVPEINVSGLKVVDKVRVKYIGRRDNYSDAVGDTGLWNRNQVKMVRQDVASKLFDHPSVYISAEDEEPSVQVETVTEPEPDERTKNTENDKELSEVRDTLMVMSSEALQRFVKDNFQRDIPGNIKKVESMRQYAIAQIDQYGLP